MKSLIGIGVTLSLMASCLLGAEDDAKAKLAAKASAILERNCLQCHRGAGSASKAKFDVRSVKSMIENENAIVLPGDPKNSRLWEMVHFGTMPPRSQPQLSRLVSADAKILADWIEAGAPEFAPVKSRPPIKLETTYQAIVADLKNIPEPKARARTRYFTLAEAHNNTAISDDSLLLTKAALTKAINSLSWEGEIVKLRAVDPKQTLNTLYAIDIEQLGWTREHWSAIRTRYPYAIGFANLPEERKALRDLDDEVLQLTKRTEPLLMVRADWFVATALQPALYHGLLYDLTLPELKKRLIDKSQPANPKHMTAYDLEQYLGIDVIADIERGEDRAMRCGFTPSGVSAQNRLLERHRIKKYPNGSYWKSYDFKADNARAILSQFPLGPVYPGNESSQLAFIHDGGEIIFNLPNGLQAYLLVDGIDGRINAGPIEVVSDALKTSGSPAIVNGLSCMSCHKEGMINPPADEIRDFARVFDKQRDHVRRLYSPKEKFNEKVDLDSKRFLTALENAIGPILKTGDHAERNIADFPEPVSDLARDYLQEELDLKGIAAELYEPNTGRLRVQLSSNEVLLQLGLGVLLRPDGDGKIKRAFWESKHGGASIMQLTAYALDYSIPQNIE